MSVIFWDLESSSEFSFSVSISDRVCPPELSLYIDSIRSEANKRKEARDTQGHSQGLILQFCSFIEGDDMFKSLMRIKRNNVRK